MSNQKYLDDSNSENSLLIQLASICDFAPLQEEDELDSGTMVRAAGDELGTVRVASTMSDGASTMIEHGDTLPSQLGTMVINAEDEEEEGTMKSKALIKSSNSLGRPCMAQRRRAVVTQAVSRPLLSLQPRVEVLEGYGDGMGLGKGQAGGGVRGREASAVRRA